MKQGGWLFAVLLLAALLAGAKLLRDARADNTRAPEGLQSGKVADLLAPALKQKRPVALVLTYDAECCETTRDFFARHRAGVKRIQQRYSDKVSFVWLDIAVYDQSDRSGLNKLGRDYGVTSVPALLLLDGAGKLAAKFEGELDEQAVRDALDRLTRGK
ncbi:MAG: thioredoxin fold domain-containing protein [Bacillota bacterium]